MTSREQAKSMGSSGGGLVVLPKLGEFARQPFTSLLVSLLLLFAVGSVFWGVFGELVMSVLMSAVLVSGAWSVARSRRVFVIALALAVPTFTLRWFFYATLSVPLGLAYIVLSICFFVLIATHTLAFVFRQRRVTMDTISGAACVYFFIGIIFAHAFSLTQFFAPGSLILAEHLQAELAQTATEGIGMSLYFSFVTLTTLGYGDISPAAPVTRSLTILESTVGQLYLTILVARLVGLHVASAPREPDADSA